MEEAISTCDFPTVANLYRLIEHRDVVHVLVPYGECPAVPHRINGSFFREAQPFVVDANRRDALTSVWLSNPIAGTDNWVILEDDRAYDKDFGLYLDMELPVI